MKGFIGTHAARLAASRLPHEEAKVAKCTVERLMWAMGLAGIWRDRKTTTTAVNYHEAPCPRDKVNHEFKVDPPCNAFWAVDFTFINA